MKAQHSTAVRLVPVFVFIVAAAFATAADRLDLAGTWRFALDRQDAGLTEDWSARPLADRMQLPGLLTAQGFGDPVSMRTAWTGQIKKIWTEDPSFREWQTDENFKMPFWLQPPRHYVGAAWYQRDFDLPADWAGQRVVLHLERPHWETRVFIDGRELGRGNSLGTPHEFDLGADLAAGRHVLTIRVDNRMIVDVGQNSHSVSDHTQGNWNGLVGRLELRRTPRSWIDDVQVHPSVRTHSVRVEVTTGGGPDGQVEATAIYAGPLREAFQITVRGRAHDGRATLDLDLGAAARAWDEFTPHLYRLDVRLDTPAGRDRRTLRFGLREAGTAGTRLTLNGHPIFLRGTLECAIFPREGHPPTDTESWRRIIRICQAHGLNHIRFHSWCPPEAAFEAADELGFYYQVEASAWANQGAQIGSGRPLDDWLEAETAAIVRAYGNHPSFLLLAYGNEPGGPRHKEWLQKYVARWQARDPRRLYTTGAGWPILPGSNFHSSPAPRLQQWGQGLKSLINAQPPRTDFDWSEWVRAHPDAPTISHEIGQWCVYPNFAEIPKYDGYFRAKNLEIFRATADRNGVLEQAADFLRVSGKLQTLCYKHDIEAALRTPGFGGFQLLDLHDFPGQGTALVGVLDPFWEEKGYVSPEAYRAFAGPVVPLARLARMTYTAGEKIVATVQLSQFGARDLAGPATWRLLDARGAELAAGELARGQTLLRGQLLDLGAIEVILPAHLPAQRLRLEIAVPAAAARNQWDLWVYPTEPVAPAPAGVHVATALDAATAAHLDAGGTVLWLAPAAQIRGDPRHGRVQMGFSSIFWNTVWTERQPPHTLGILCSPRHPALAWFPTEEHSNWQWWEIMQGATPFILTTHRALRPIVQVVDDWSLNRKLGLIFEARVGRGRILACAVDLTADLSRRPVARQLRHSLLSYLGSPAFKPSNEITLDDLRGLIAPAKSDAR